MHEGLPSGAAARTQHCLPCYARLHHPCRWRCGSNPALPPLLRSPAPPLQVARRLEPSTASLATLACTTPATSVAASPRPRLEPHRGWWAATLLAVLAVLAVLTVLTFLTVLTVLTFCAYYTYHAYHAYHACRSVATVSLPPSTRRSLRSVSKPLCRIGCWPRGGTTPRWPLLPPRPTPRSVRPTVETEDRTSYKDSVALCCWRAAAGITL